MTSLRTLLCLAAIIPSVYLSIRVFQGLSLSAQCAVYDNTINRVRFISRAVEPDGSLSSLNDFKEACQGLEAERYLAEHPYTPSPMPKPEDTGMYGSLRSFDEHDGSMILFVHSEEETAVFRYYPGLGTHERLDDTIASICPAMPTRD
jgi:hypothetical protein